MDGNIVSANTKNVHKFALQQKARGILFVVVIVVPVFLGAVAYLTYTDMVSQQDETTAVATESTPEQTSPSTQAPSSEIIAPAPPTSENPTQSQGASSTPQSSPTPRSAPSSALPDGLVTALNSIETNGLKGSAYVSSSFDTSSIPDGTSISFNRSSWVKESDTSGSISGTVFLFGQPQNGSVRFVESGGVWRATGYTLN